MAVIRTELILERFNHKMKLLERRRQQSRSWTINLLGILYAAHGQFAPATPVATLVNIDGQVSNVDIGSQVKDYRPSIIRVGAGPGHSQELIEDSVPTWWGWQDNMSLLGCDIGILVGTDNTAVTPTNNKLNHKIGHGRRPPDGAALVFEQYNAGDDADFQVYTVNWGGMVFAPSVDHRCTSVLVKIWKTGAPGDLTVELRTVVAKSDQSADAIGNAVLATGTIAEAAIPAASPGALTECTWVTPVDLYAGHRYAIVLHCGGAVANRVNWRYDNTAATYERSWDFCARTMTNRLDSVDSGATWMWRSNKAFLFQEKGQSQGEFEYGGCELSNIAFADPNGSFTIRRFFYNNCGSSLTVQEVGIAVPGTWHITGTGYPSTHPFLIARDVVAPGLAVNNGELLRASYVPAITV